MLYMNTSRLGLAIMGVAPDPATPSGKVALPPVLSLFCLDNRLDNLTRYLAGEPLANVVDLRRGY
jgi:hypothetical protein